MGSNNFDSQKINTDQIYHSPKWAEWYYIASSPGHSPPKSALFGWEWPGDVVLTGALIPSNN